MTHFSVAEPAIDKNTQALFNELKVDSELLSKFIAMWLSSTKFDRDCVAKETKHWEEKCINH